MGTIADVAVKVKVLKEDFPKTITDTLKESTPLIKSMIQDQLMAGVDENGKPLKPSYLDDPYFGTVKSGKRAGQKRSDRQRKFLANLYMEWKEKLYPPASTFLLGLRARSIETPNLIIIGPYHQSITPRIVGDKIVTESIGFYAGDDIEKKYGSSHLGLTKEARAHLVEYRLTPAITNLLKELGFK
ncbi:hypothetical protein DW083_16465 [Parabacteroides sp. AF48-14]|uniref:hypothetical protein n=1 Tax=Parabacteroides sp. AF48-14 TaxID=2292052 RepID=UPI000F000671|nr:hypothetical protein [Parabacteroides sp. AF48-14]RHO68254.1 hypothetical protein DW083_16465 [Parabacteroides sp. AF48-14]